MPNKLEDIAITHISLVKAGANGKQIIYKSADEEGGYEHTVRIAKSDDEKGVVYGIVYAPDEVDSQGDFTTADEIEKAAYNFMKSLNARNVDVEHSFQSEDAFVAESWILKSGDPVFPDEKEGSWAVAIKLESDELKALAKSGKLAGLSMAGAAKRVPVEKSGEGEKGAFAKLFAALADAVSDVWFDFGGVIKKSKGDDDMADEIKKFGEAVRDKLQKATQAIADAVEKEGERIEAVEKEIAQVHKQMQDELKKAAEENAALKDELAKAHARIEELEKAANDAKATAEEVKKEVQKSKQKTAPKTGGKTSNAKEVM